LIQKELLKLKKEITSNELNLINIFLKKRDGQSYLLNHTLLIDHTLNKLWKELDFKNSASLIACGGFGRRELFPYSDIDLLILIPKKLDTLLSQKIEHFITLLWDLGLRIGHSVRNLSETKKEIKKDITVQTNLLESRYLAGNKTLFKELNKIIRDTLIPHQFYEGKLKEQDRRHQKYNQSAYQLEPNIKESPGGLRDLQMIQWIGKSHIAKFNLQKLNQKKYLAFLSSDITADFFFLASSQTVREALDSSCEAVESGRSRRLEIFILSLPVSKTR